ncbi:MAG: DUF2934 domain-containing protein [Kiritimatiellia bacterium]|nr:DUF2934 domain-containing protein [Kiritimatiellia bacterium]
MKKTKAAKPAAKAAAPLSALPKKVVAAAAPTRTITPQQRHQRIAEAAYYLALRKGFEKSDARLNWIEAERQVDADLAAQKIKIAG